MGGLDDRLGLVLRHLRALCAVAQAEHAAGRHDLDDVDAALHVLAHDGAAGVGPVESVGMGQQVHDLRAVTVRRVGMATRGADGGAGGVGAGALDPAGGDGLAGQRRRGVVVVAEVAHRGETGEQGLLRVEGGTQRVVARIQIKSFRVTFRRLLAVEVDMHVHQARHERAIDFEVDHGVAGGRRGRNRPRSTRCGRPRRCHGHAFRTVSARPSIRLPAWTRTFAKAGLRNAQGKAAGRRRGRGVFMTRR